MEFQVYNVSLEDRYPRGLPEGVTRDDLLEDDFHYHIEGVLIEKSQDGSIAMIFGRTAEGASVCVRVEGVRPRL